VYFVYYLDSDKQSLQFQRVIYSRQSPLKTTKV